MATKQILGITLAALMASIHPAPAQSDPGRVPTTRLFPTGNVIFFHPDGTSLNHFGAARLYFKGQDGVLNWDLLPNMAPYRGHMGNNPIGTSNGGATTHAFGYKVDGLGSFGKDGDGSAVPPTDRFINGLSGFQGSIMRQAANQGIPVGVVNDGHIGEPGTGCFLAEVGNRNNWQEITRQMIQGRPGFTDTDPWVIMGGGEADTRPQGTTLLHRNWNQERGQAQGSQLSLRTDNLDLEAIWNAKGSGALNNNPAQLDDYIVIKTRAQFELLKNVLATNTTYAPHVLGLFGFQDLFNDRNEEDLIARGTIVTNLPVGHVGPAPQKASRIVLWGDPDSTRPGHNPPTFAEMTDVAIRILDRAAKQQIHAINRRFFLVAEQEANDNFGNNDNAIGLLHAMKDTDDAIGIARNYAAQNPRTLILTGSDSDAGGMQITAPYRNVVNSTGVPGFASLTNYIFGFGANPASGQIAITNFVDGVEGRNTPHFLSEPDQFGQVMEFAIAWSGTGDYTGAILARAGGLNSGLLNSVFASRFDNVDVYRLMYLTLFGPLLNYPNTFAPTR